MYKINETVNKLLLIGNKFMHKVHLKQPGFTYNACGPFTKNKERIEKIMRTANTGCIYKNDFDEAWFQQVMVYVKYKKTWLKQQNDV